MRKNFKKTIQGDPRWKILLEEYKVDLDLFANLKLQSKQHARKSPAPGYANDPQYEALRDEMFVKTLLNNPDKLMNLESNIPYIEGIEDATEEARMWFNSPPSVLGEGLEQLAKGEVPENLSLIMSLYGDYRQHSAILHGRNLNFVQYENAHQGAKESHNRHRTYAASFMLVLIKYGGTNIKAARSIFLDHVIAVIDGKAEPRLLLKEQFGQFLAKPRLIRPGQRSVDVKALHNSVHRDLSASSLEFHSLDLLVEFFRISSPQTLGLDPGT